MKPHLKVVGSKPDASGAAAVGNGQRGLWTLLMFTLVGPFVAALIVFLLTTGAGLMQAGPSSLKGLTTPALMAKAAEWAITSFVWSALPAALAGLALAMMALLRGGFHWLYAAAASAIAATVFAQFSAGNVARDHTSFIAFFAALSGIAVWAVLKRARIIA